MLEYVLLALLGLGVGVFGTLVGAGGGFVLVPILLLIFPERDASTITAMSLVVVMANAISGASAYARQRRIDYVSGLLFAASTFPGAVAGAIVVGYISRQVFDLMFAFILGGIGLYLFARSPGNAVRAPISGRGIITREITDGQGNVFRFGYRLWLGMVLSLIIGFFSSMLGIGGGVINVPVMATVLHFPVHIAVATSQFTLMLMSGQSVGTHLVAGTLEFDRNFAEALCIAAGAIPGAQIGARLSRRLRGDAIIRVLAISLVIVSLRLAWSGITG